MKLFHKKSNTAGLPPGTLVMTGEKKAEKTRITVFTFNRTTYQEKEIAPDSLKEYKDLSDMVWINVDGLGEADILEQIGRIFDIHPLTLEDIMDTDQRPKVEEHDHYLLVVLKMIYTKNESFTIDTEQVSLILKKGVVISFQEVTGDVFDVIRERIRCGKGRIREMGADYLVYALMDAMVDNYFIIMEQLGDAIEQCESEILDNADARISLKIHEQRRKAILLRRSIWPLRGVINSMQHSDMNLVKKTTLPFIRDLYDHTIHIIETLETFRDVLSGMRDIYLSSVSNRMNEIMKVLTIIATVFMPLSFIAGVYGMNFKYMPELEWRWGYAGVLILMLMFIIGFFGYFRHRKWL